MPSSMGISDFPRSDKLYSTLGGICGYSLRKISPSASSSFSEHENVLKEMPFIYLCNSLYLTTPNSISVYKMVILYLPLSGRRGRNEVRKERCGGEISGKKCAFIACCEEDDMSVLDGVRIPYERTVALLKWKSVGEVLVPGVLNRGDIDKTDGCAEAAGLAKAF